MTKKIANHLVAGLVIVVLGGCQSVPVQQDEPEQPQVATTAVPSPEQESDVLFGGSQNEESTESNRYELVPGSGEFVNSEAGKRREYVFPEDGEVILNFEGESLPEVVKAILGDALQENYVIAPGVSGNVTFSTSKPVKLDELLSILELLLSWNNASLVYADGRYNVVPIGRAIKGLQVPVIDSADGQRGYEVRAFPLSYISPTEMEKLLQPFANDNAVISADNARGLLILAGTKQELLNYEQTIEIFDVDWLKGMSVGIYPLERVEADTVVGELEAIFGEGSGTPLAGLFRFVPIERINAVLVITPQPDYLSAAVEWVERLDRGGSEAGTRLYVYDVKNVNALDLADTLSDVFGGSGSSSGSRRSSNQGQVAPGVQAGEITSINDRRSRVQEQNQNRQNRAGSGDGGLALSDGEEIRITAVEESNSLLIRATPGQYDSVLGAIKRLDSVPLQVLIEAQIIEVTLNENLSYGVNWFFENAVTGFSLNPDTGGDTGGGAPAAKGLFDSQASLSTDRSATLSSSGFSYSILGGDTAAIISALEEQTDVRTISAPSLMVLNNREANINIGDQIPVNSPIFNTGTGTNIGQSRVQFRDTGVTLNVVPRVNPGGLVFMEIQQEVSAALPNASDTNGNVTVRQRRLDTEIAVQSGETIVLGGLIQTTLNESANGLPVLSKIPLVGGLFGTQATTVDRTELLILISPTVVTSIDEAREVSREYRNKLKGIKPFDFERNDIRKKANN